jgi:cobalt-zinc-cadmium efflux system membrane fusion protein
MIMTNNALCGISPRVTPAAAFMVIAALLSFAGCSPKKENSSADTVARNVTLTDTQRQHIRLYTVVPSRFHKTIETTGAVDFDNDQATSVIAPISGPVTRLLVSPGDKVKNGAPLAMVDSSDFAAATSAYSKAMATARNARRLADMDNDLLQHNGVSQREADQAKTDAVNAEADRDAALQSLAALNVDPRVIKDIQDGRPISRIPGMIRAPISGTVAERLITPGQLLQAGTTPSFTIADLSRVWVMAQIFGSDLATIDVGDRAEVVTGMTSRNLSGRVDNISAVVNPDTRSVAVRVAVDNPQELLKKQMYVRVLIHSRQESRGLLVPVSAILRDDENLPFVYVAQRDGSFARRHVTLGYRAGEQYDIPAGLKAGDQVVTDGGLFVQFMQNQ